jgi:tetratricopeptide (TPR) repeat protein
VVDTGLNRICWLAFAVWLFVPGLQGEDRAEVFTKAKDLIAQGRATEAAAILSGLVGRASKDGEAYLLLGTALALIPKRTEALQALRRAVELSPDSPQAHHTLAMALARFGELDEARRAYERTLKLDPELKAAHGSLAVIMAAQGDVDGALVHFTEALRRETDAAAAARYHYLRGKLYRQRNMPAAAARDFERALQLNPLLAKAYLELGGARVDLQDHSGALQALRRAVELAPDDPDARYELGSAYLRAGQAQLSLEHLAAAFRLQPDSRSIVYALARALQAAGRNDEARPLLERLRQMAKEEAFHNPNVVKAGELNNAGIALEKEGRFADALENYRAAVALNPREVSFRRNLGLVLCRLGRWQEAAVELKEVLRARPGDLDATRALYIALENIHGNDHAHPGP